MSVLYGVSEMSDFICIFFFMPWNRCDKCTRSSSLPSRFYELELNIQGNKNLTECLTEFLKVNILLLNEEMRVLFCDFSFSFEEWFFLIVFVCVSVRACMRLFWVVLVCVFSFVCLCVCVCLTQCSRFPTWLLVVAPTFSHKYDSTRMVHTWAQSLSETRVTIFPIWLRTCAATELAGGGQWR